MIITVTVSEFRDNLSKYIDLLRKKGNEVEIKDGRKGNTLLTLVKKKKKRFDWDEHIKFLEDFKPIFTDVDVEKIKELRKRSRRRIKKYNW